MSDILSGGVIDDSTDGPIPSKVDDRSRDIIAEQREIQRQDAIGGTAEPPIVNPPEQIPEPPKIAPPLPIIPSFDFSIVGSLAEETREVARQATIDVIKNVTINGQGPSIEGSNISFNIPQERQASEMFLFQDFGAPIPQHFLTPQAPDESIVIKTSTERTKSINVDRREYEGGELSSYKSIPEGEKYEGGELSSYRSFPEGEKYEGGELSSYPTFRTREEYDEKREQRRNNLNFDRESDIRQRGESPREFRERQEQLKEERERRAQEEKEKSNFIKQAETGIIKEFPSGMIPVRLTRADGQKKVLALMATDFVGVVEGNTAGDRPAILPSDDSYYEAGGGTLPPHPWQVVLRVNENKTVDYKIESSSSLYTSFKTWSSISVAGIGNWQSVSEGFLLLKGTVNTGVVQSAEIEGPTSGLGNRMTFSGGTPNEQTDFRALIAYIYQVEENWFVRQYAFHNFTMTHLCVDGRPAIYPFAT